MLYRICTENKDYNSIRDLVSERFEGFTIIKAIGFWNRQKEHSLIIEIVTPSGMGDGATRDKVEHLAYAIRKLNDQDAILVQYIAETHRLF